jgi:hypothetical protein
MSCLKLASFFLAVVLRHASYALHSRPPSYSKNFG